MLFDRPGVSLNKKLLLSLAIPALLLAAVGGAGILSVRVLAGAADRILSDNYRSIQAAGHMERALLTMDSCFLPGGECDAGAVQAAKEFEQALIECENNITEPEEPALVREIRTGWDELQARLPAPGAANANPLPLYDRLGKLIEINERAMFASERSSRRTAVLMTSAVTAAMLIGLLALFIFAFIAARRISRPILEVAEKLHKALAVAEAGGGKGKRQVDEIARLRAEMDELLVRLTRYDGEQAHRFRELQDRFLLVSNQVREGLLLLGEDFRILYINQQGRRILGLESEDLPGCSLRDLQLNERVASLLRPIFADEAVQETDLGEFPLSEEGEKRIYRPRFLPGRLAGMPEASLLIFWDVTEQRRFDEARQGFIAMLSHQLKTPITSLTMAVNLLQERLQGITPECTELLNEAKTGCAGLNLLVAELIDTARETAPEMTLRPTRIDLAPLLRNAIKPLKTQADEKGLTICDELGGKPAWATVDPIKFSWVVTNAIGNSLRYTPRGGSITIRLTQTPSQIEILIVDTGIGIPPERLRGIFTPPDPAELRDPGSHGLGLSIAKEIIDAHRGGIFIDSRPGAGTSVHLTIPQPEGD